MNDNTRTMTPVNHDVEQFCVTNPEASFCSGPSVRECPSGRYIPEHHMYCEPVGNTVEEEPELYKMLQCNEAGGKWMSEPQVCIDKEPDIQDTNTETATPAPAPVDTLPETGINDALFGTALAMIAFGVGLLRYVRN